jgi:RNA polymerase sigma factor (sigma-70 family)
MHSDTSQSSSELLPTRRSLLSRLKQLDDHASWQEFHQLYHRLIFSFAVRQGLTEAEAKDAVRETFVAVTRSMPSFRYDPAHCSFKSWLRHLAEKRVIDQLRRRNRDRGRWEPASTADLDEQLAAAPDLNTPSPDAAWDEEWRRQILETALERVRARVNPKQFRVFHSLVIQEIPAAEVRAMFDVSLTALYVAKQSGD